MPKFVHRVAMSTADEVREVIWELREQGGMPVLYAGLKDCKPVPVLVINDGKLGRQWIAPAAAEALGIKLNSNCHIKSSDECP